MEPRPRVRRGSSPQSRIDESAIRRVENNSPPTLEAAVFSRYLLQQRSCGTPSPPASPNTTITLYQSHDARSGSQSQSPGPPSPKEELDLPSPNIVSNCPASSPRPPQSTSPAKADSHLARTPHPSASSTSCEKRPASVD